MNIMGMGIPELAVIFLVAFLVLGPAKAIDTARNAGKVLGDLRRSFNDVTGALNIETMEQRPRASDQSQPPAQESAPGVPIRPDTVSEDDDPVGDDNPRPKTEDQG